MVSDATQIWNISWISTKTIKDIFTNQPIIDQQKIEDMPEIIEPIEIKTFNNYQ